jgi:arsenite methyltransferase
LSDARRDTIAGPSRAADLAAATIKQCCAASYDSGVAKLLMGESFHPGGTGLTERLGQMLGLSAGMCVLDVAAGTGTSAIFVAKRFGCHVIGIDYSPKNIAGAARNAEAEGLADKTVFQCADAEELPFPEGSFDAIICECALCTFPDKQAATNEFRRVLRDGGQVGISDLTREGSLAQELNNLMSWVACIADSRPLAGYAAILSAANLTVRQTEAHNDALAEFVKGMRTRLLAAEVMAKLGKLILPDFDLEAAKSLAKHAQAAIDEGRLGYAIITALKPV